jgi:hypothetical protein
VPAAVCEEEDDDDESGSSGLAGGGGGDGESLDGDEPGSIWFVIVLNGLD